MLASASSGVVRCSVFWGRSCRGGSLAHGTLSLTESRLLRLVWSEGTRSTRTSSIHSLSSFAEGPFSIFAQNQLSTRMQRFFKNPSLRTTLSDIGMTREAWRKVHWAPVGPSTRGPWLLRSASFCNMRTASSLPCNTSKMCGHLWVRCRCHMNRTMNP